MTSDSVDSVSSQTIARPRVLNADVVNDNSDGVDVTNTNTNTFISGKNPYTIGTYIKTSK